MLNMKQTTGLAIVLIISLILATGACRGILQSKEGADAPENETADDSGNGESSTDDAETDDSGDSPAADEETDAPDGGEAEDTSDIGEAAEDGAADNSGDETASSEEGADGDAGSGEEQATALARAECPKRIALGAKAPFCTIKEDNSIELNIVNSGFVNISGMHVEVLNKQKEKIHEFDRLFLFEKGAIASVPIPIQDFPATERVEIFPVDGSIICENIPILIYPDRSCDYTPIYLVINSSA